jgi:hypothetical protein
VKSVKHKTDGRIEGDSLSAKEIDEAHTVWMNGSLIFIVTKKMYGDAKGDSERQTLY